MKKYIFGIFYTVFLIAFTTYIILDTFVIERVYTVVPENGNSNSYVSNITDSSTPNNEQIENKTEANNEITDNSQTEVQEEPKKDTILTENSYSDGNITITITEYRQYDTTIYVADIKVASAEYLKTAFAKNTYGRNITQKTSEMAKSNNTILAINGDYYGSQQRGYVLRNGVLYRENADSNQEDLVIYKDGSFEIINESQASAKSLYEKGAQQILSFGPALVSNGKISVSERDEVGQAMASNPRTAIGIIDDLHYVFVVSDGRTRESEGLSLYELAEFMKTLNVNIAYNLDGGGSSTMVFNGKVINNPTTNGRTIQERSVSDIVYIGY